ncbi:MAG: DNA-processing protein DprA [Clostridia bacterium]|nr:DNA-processing protein DprA [Clostridia bacterium]
MYYSDDAFAAMLLTMALSPNREEYARPFSVQEFRRLEEAVRTSALHSLGRLLNMDIGGLMMYLGISEEEAYRIFTLLNRSVQLTYGLEGFVKDGIEVVTIYDEDYPRRLSRKMKHSAPPFFYRCGNKEKLNSPAIAILGISGVKTTNEVRDGIETLVRKAVDMGYAIITGGELGVSRVVSGMVMEMGGALIDVLGGNMTEHIRFDGIEDMIGQGRCTVLSLEHPDAMFTVSHAISRNKLLFSLADAAFVFNTDGKRGETDALQNHYCDWIYAWNGYPANHNLISRGAIPINDLHKLDMDEMSRHWNSSRSEQVSMFDLFE